MLRASALGKFILFEEHAVGYGKTAVAIAASRRIEGTVRRSERWAVDGEQGRGRFYLKNAVKRFWNSGLLNMAVGEIRYEGIEKLVCAPVESVKASTGRYVLIMPGKRRKEDVAREIAKLFDWPVDSVVSILPPGPAEIVEMRDFEDDW